MTVNISFSTRVAFRLYYQAEYWCNNKQEVNTNTRPM